MFVTTLNASVLVLFTCCQIKPFTIMSAPWADFEDINNEKKCVLDTVQKINKIN